MIGQHGLRLIRQIAEQRPGGTVTATRAGWHLLIMVQRLRLFTPRTTRDCRCTSGSQRRDRETRGRNSLRGSWASTVWRIP
jgi:hypothetical protein